MFLTRVELDIKKRKTQIALASPNKFHGALESSFMNKQKRNLWRIDSLNGHLYFMVLSEELPDMASFIYEFGIADSIPESKDYMLLMDRIKKDSVWRFRLTANPTHAVKHGEGRGKVVAHITEQHQKEWLISKGVKNGFCLINDECRVISSEWKRFYKHGGRPEAENHKKSAQMLLVTFEGILKVEDPEMFKKALSGGIGRGKAYGAGLLTVAGKG